MKLLSALTGLMAVATVSAAAPPSPATTKIPSADPKDYKQYYLKTKVIIGRKNHRFNNTYVQPYHTGAGLSDAALTKNRSTTYTAYLNGTFNLLNIAEDDQPFYPWGTVMTTDVTYAGKPRSPSSCLIILVIKGPVADVAFFRLIRG